MKTHALVAGAACLLALSAHADDWPQWRGPNRDNVSKETGLLKEWPKGGPKLLWTYKNGGVGYSGPAIVGDVLYCAGARGEDEYLYALDLKQGPPKDPPKELWAVRIGPLFTWPNNSWNAGPITTPSVDGNRVYVIGGGGDFLCVENGKEKWRSSLLKDLNGEVDPVGGGLGSEEGDPKLGWGYAGSPLVDGDVVICVPGGPAGTLAALEKDSGKVRWRSKELTAQATYSSPVAADIGGVRQYIQVTNEGAAGVAAKDGKLLWYYKREEPFGDVVAPTPVVKGDLVFITSTRNGGGRDAFRVKADAGKFAAEKLYADNKVENDHGGAVLVGDHVYTCSGDTVTAWVCQDLKSGDIKWSENPRALGKGSLTAADGCLYCVGERTNLVMLVEASPEGWKPKGQFKLPEESKLRKKSGRLWTHPVVANGRLYLRDQDLIFCYDVKGK
jgi:outer membrane protein assembly factor BamB